MPSKATCSSCHVERNEYPFYYTIQQDTTSTRSGISHNNSLSITNSDIVIEKDKLIFLNESPLKSSLNQNHLNKIYEKILQNLPQHIDLRYFTVSILSTSGCYLEIPNTGISLTIPEDAVIIDEDCLIYMALINVENQMPMLNNNQTRLSPCILIGPADITLVKPAVLSFEHSALLESAWKFNIMFTEDMIQWKSILTYGHETISTPIYLQFNRDRKAFLLVRILVFFFFTVETFLFLILSLKQWVHMH